MLYPKTSTNVRCEKAKNLRGAFEMFCRGGSPRLLALQLVVALVWRATLSPLTWTDLWILIGVFVWWPFQEWGAHLWILHQKPRKIGSWTVDSAAAKVHRYHHRNPWELEAIFVPSVVILALMPIHAICWIALTPNLSLAFSGIIAYTAASLMYEWIHFFAHIPYRPKSNWMKTIQKNHLAHHFKNEHYWHAFTIPAIDKLMGTGPDPKQTQRSPTCRSLGVETR